MESLENISRLQLINLIFRSKDFQSYLIWYLNSGNLNKTKYRQRIGEVIQNIERFRKCKEFMCHGSILEKDIATQILQVITSPDNVFNMLVKYQKVTERFSKKSLLKYLQSIILKNFYDESGYHRIIVNNFETCMHMVCCVSLNTKEKFPFYCLLDNLACNIENCNSIMDLTFVQKFQAAAICNAGFVVRHLWSTANEDDRKMLLNECKETITLQLASVLGMGDIVKWFLEREVSINYSLSQDHNTILHIAAQAGNVGVIEVLIDKGVTINALNFAQETPVHAAAAGGCLDAITLLWNNNAKLDLSCKDGNTPLHSAVYKGHVSVVNFLLENGLEVNARNNKKTAPLHLAAITGNVDLINILIKKGADKNAEDYISQTPLQKACFRDFSSVIEVLLKKWGARLHSQNFAKCTTELHVAVTRGYFKCAYVLLECGADPNAIDTKGKTPLHFAARGGFHSLAKLLLNSNANVFEKDDRNRTAMHEACYNGHKAIVELLLSKQDNIAQLINVQDQKGQTPLQYACRKGHTCLVEYLLNCDNNFYSADADGRTILHEAAWNGHKDIVELILKIHPNKANLVNIVDHKGATAMQLANHANHESIVNLLQSNGATFYVMSNTKAGIRHDRPLVKEIKWDLDISAKNEYGETQLHVAVRLGEVARVESILKHKDLKVNLKDLNQATALHLAIHNKRPEIVNLLIKCKSIDLNAKNEDHNTPLHCAVLEEYVEVLYLLFRSDVIRKIKINPRNKLNETPLHLAAKSKNVEILRMLLRRKVDFYIKTSTDKTALQIAIEAGNLEIVQCLIENKDDVDVRNKNGETILHLSIRSGRLNLIKWILDNHADQLNFQNCNGNTGLHFAVMSKNLAIVRAVLQTKGIMVNLRNNRQETPLLLLAAHWTKVNAEIIKCLLENPTNDVNVKLPNGRNALHLFAGKCNKNGIFAHFNEKASLVSECSVKCDVIKNKLIVCGLANAQDQDGYSVLHLTASTGNLELLKLLLDCDGIDINLQNNAGETGLHLACREGHVDCVKMMLKHKKISIDNEMKDYPWTPLVLALNGKHWDIVLLLLQKGAKVDIEIDSCGSSPLDFLIWEYSHGRLINKHLDIVRLLLMNGAKVDSRIDYGESCPLNLTGEIDLIWFKLLELYRLPKCDTR